MNSHGGQNRPGTHGLSAVVGPISATTDYPSFDPQVKNVGGGGSNFTPTPDSCGGHTRGDNHGLPAAAGPFITTGRFR
jgi:hypothetical protein